MTIPFYRRLALAICFIRFLHGRGTHASDSEQYIPPLVVFSIESFRWDFIYRIGNLTESRGRSSHLWTLIEESAYAPEGVGSVFNTASYPNQYTMITGLYEESHGVLSDREIYDPTLNRTADLNNYDPENAWVLKGEPIWETLSKQSQRQNESRNGSAACYGWFGCAYANMTHYEHAGNPSWRHRVDKAIEWLRQGVQLVLISYSEFSKLVCVHGPGSDRVDEALLEIDYNVGYLVERLKNANFYGQVNLMIVSDHGITEVIEDKPLLPNHDLPSYAMVRSRDSAVMLLDIERGHVERALEYFQYHHHLTAFRKEDIREEWHYKHCERISSLVLLAQPGYSFIGGHKGASGYDNRLNDMRGTFVGHGPAFTPNATVPRSMSTVDTYGLMSRLLNVTAAPNNGSTGHFDVFLNQNYLVNAPAQSSGVDDFGSFVIVIILAVALFLGVLIIGWFCHTSDVCTPKEPDMDPVVPWVTERTPLIQKSRYQALY